MMAQADRDGTGSGRHSADRLRRPKPDDAAIPERPEEAGGRGPSPRATGQRGRLHIQGEARGHGTQSRSYKMTIKLDPAAMPDKTIDFQIDEGPDDAKGKTSKGIYKFDGDDKFIFCMRPIGERPDKFEMVGFEQILSELKRKKSS